MADSETYIGDDIYASLENGAIKLRTPRNHGDDVIYLEPEAFIELLRFARNIHFLPHKRAVPPAGNLSDYPESEGGNPANWKSRS